MNSKPTYPVIIIDDTTGYLDLIDSEDGLTTSTALGLAKNVYKNFCAYDGNGFQWRIRNIDSEYKINGLTKILAYSFYNPKVKVNLHWMIAGNYQMPHLISGIKTQVDRDDDILTQFEEGDVIKEKIQAASTFDEVIIILNKYVFKVNEQELWKEQESRK